MSPIACDLRLNPKYLLISAQNLHICDHSCPERVHFSAFLRISGQFLKSLAGCFENRRAFQAIFSLLVALTLIQYVSCGAFVELNGLAMARSRGRKSQYEVMRQGRLKPSYGKVLQQQQAKTQEKPESAAPVPDVAKPTARIELWARPKAIQVNAGRIEISLPYQWAVAIVLGLVLVVLVAFRLGQIDQRVANSATGIQETGQESPPPRDPGGTDQARVPGQETLRRDAGTDADVGKGDNVIVLVQYHRLADLAPVRQHFAEYGVQTEIVQQGGTYFLITKNRYDNPDSPGTDGYRAKQKIIEVGARYKGKAPEGCETFAPHYFRDAYGKKIN